MAAMWTRSGWISICPSMFVYRTPVAPTVRCALVERHHAGRLRIGGGPADLQCAWKPPVTSVTALVALDKIRPRRQSSVAPHQERCC